MDAQQEQQQKEFLSAFFPPDLSGDHAQRSQSSNPMFSFTNNDGSTVTQQHLSGLISSPANGVNPQVNLDLLGNLMSLPGIEGQSSNSQQLPQYNPQLLLEQQFKLTQLQQLQQLQNQIFQQQIALISGQAGNNNAEASTEPRRDQPAAYHGLPTPGPSTELRAQPNSDYVSPMILHYMDTPQQQQQFQNQPMDTVNPLNTHSSYTPSRGSASAPGHLAFNTSPSLPLPSPAELDFDISPLTSPWLGAQQQTVPPWQTSNKRTASSSGDESSTKPSRKKQSPAIRPTNSTHTTKNSLRGSKSTNSTPLLRSSRTRKGSIVGDGTGDTPSPVDLFMPPPAPRSSQFSSSSTSSSTTSSEMGPSPNLNPHLTPVTPASIMNLGRLGITSSLTPPTSSQSNSEPKAKGSSRPRVTIDAPARSRPIRKSPSGTGISPNLKTILPAVNTSNANSSTSGSAGQADLPVKKTSHKAAEQKRRDSLKTTFDDLRVLLPPIPLPSDDNFPNEPILPGALPPRGPPKAGGEGPNKGVSKLQLLRCGNDFIRRLNGRVNRRDDEIQRLRQEVSRLRGLIGPEAWNENGEEFDLYRDLDAVEASNVGLGCGGSDDEADEGND